MDSPCLKLCCSWPPVFLMSTGVMNFARVEDCVKGVSTFKSWDSKSTGRLACSGPATIHLQQAVGFSVRPMAPPAPFTSSLFGLECLLNHSFPNSVLGCLRAPWRGMALPGSESPGRRGTPLPGSESPGRSWWKIGSR